MTCSRSSLFQKLSVLSDLTIPPTAMAYQDDKYENHFLALVAATSRPTMLKFADFSTAAVAMPGVPAMVAVRAAALKTARDAYRDDMVDRIGAGGTSKAGTATEQEAFETFKAFIQRYDAKALSGYLFDHSNQTATYYPHQLGGLTQAIKKNRLTRLTAYTEALETADATLPADQQLPAVPVALDAPAGTQPERPGTAARSLLTAYAAAATQRTGGRTALKKEIVDLSPAGTALAQELWTVHCFALAAHHAAPAQARAYFDYTHLPHRNARGKGTTKS